MLGMNRKTLSALLLFSLAALVQGCGGGGGHASCTLGAGDCDMGQVCEQLISGDGAQCFAPVQIEGRVFDAIDDTGVAGAKDAVLMASAMRKAVEAGREAFLAGRMPMKRYATASSPSEGQVR